MATKKVLTVDDSKTIREMVRFTLQKMQFEVHEAEDGLKGLNMVTTVNPDLIISDVNMPNMDGLTMIKKIRENPQFKSTPILMLTTEQSDEKKNEARQAGATGWIVKPFDPEKLISIIQKVCE